MKITCDMIRDLLPLYHDGVCSEDSKENVNEHLKSCEKCKEELQLMEDHSNTSRIKIEDERVVKASAAAWKKRKNNSFAVGCLVALLAVVIVAGNYVAYHWFSTANENNIEALKRQATDYLGAAVLDILDIEKRGNYLAMLYKSEDSKSGMCVFDRDRIFDNRWKAGGGKLGFGAGEIESWNFGSPGNEAVLIFCGADISKEACWYTFQNANITYTCPIVHGRVLDVFVIQDGGYDINGYPTLLDRDKQEIE